MLRCRLLIGPFFLCLAVIGSHSLSVDFYATSCPDVASIVSSTIKKLAAADNVVPPSTLRLFVHDCFVQGCDASIMIKSTAGNQAEREAKDNNIPGNPFSAIEQAKAAVEQSCPGVVSCADILALAARDVIVFMGGPNWQVPLGRLDGLVSKTSDTAGHLPSANSNVPQLLQQFEAMGLNLQDLVSLSGGHTIGFSHCEQFTNRLYSFGTESKTDPTLDPDFATQLKSNCPQSDTNKFQSFDIATPFKFDNQYYKNLQQGKGLLFSDQALFLDNATRSIVDSFATNQDQFFAAFVQSMIKMSSIGVKTGSQGEVRRDCTAFNGKGSSNQPPINPSPINPPPTNPSSQPPPVVTTPPDSNPPSLPPFRFPRFRLPRIPGFPRFGGGPPSSSDTSAQSNSSSQGGPS